MCEAIETEKLYIERKNELKLLDCPQYIFALRAYTAYYYRKQIYIEVNCSIFFFEEKKSTNMYSLTHISGKSEKKKRCHSKAATIKTKKYMYRIYKARA